MKKILALSVFILGLMPVVKAQIETPIKWAYSAVKTGDKTYDLKITATLDPKWHIYAQDAGEGPEPTSFSFTANPLVKLEGKVREAGKLEKSYDPNFKSTLKYYSNKVDFIQKVKLKTTASTVVKGSVTFMICNDHKCQPPKEIPFSIKIAGK